MMKFMTLWADIPEVREDLKLMIGKKTFTGATAKHICVIPVLYDDDNSFAYNALGLCLEGNLLSYLKTKRACKRNPQWFVKGWL